MTDFPLNCHGCNVEVQTLTREVRDELPFTDRFNGERTIRAFLFFYVATVARRWSEKHHVLANVATRNRYIILEKL
jgi:hypothetical protein